MADVPARWDISAVLPPERLHALERGAVTAFANTFHAAPAGPEGRADSAAPDVTGAGERAAVPVVATADASAVPVTDAPAVPVADEPAVPVAPPVTRPVAVPVGPAAAPAPVPAPRQPGAGGSWGGRLALPAGVAVTAAGLAAFVASATETPRIGPRAVAEQVPATHAAPPAAGPATAPATASGAAAAAPRDRASRPAASATPSTPSVPVGLAPLPRARPVVVEVPRLRVRAEVRDLGLRPDGSLDVPADVRVSGWYAGGPAPGQRGAAVVVGHVDSTDGPGVFHPLLGARPGDEVTVRRADGTAAVFRVYRVAAYPKTAFPTDLVYRSGGMELRLVTCSGEFDRRTRHYRDNLVVFARRIG